MVNKKEFDGRMYNKRGGISRLHKIRKLVTNNKTGDAYGITIPQEIALQFSGCKLNLYISGNCLIMESGNNLEKTMITQEQFESTSRQFMSSSYNRSEY